MRALRFAAGSALVLASIGCHHTVIVQNVAPPPPFQRITIASLPLANDTANMSIGATLRQNLAQRFGSKGYLVQPPGDTDERLRAMGITLGGQINGVAPKEFHDKLGVDAVVSGTIHQASSLITGVYNRRVLDAEITLTDTRTGSVIWTQRNTVTSQDTMRAKYGVDALVGAANGVERANLANESANLSSILVNHMPWCPREGDLGWNGLALPPSPPPPPN